MRSKKEIQRCIRGLRARKSEYQSELQEEDLNEGDIADLEEQIDNIEEKINLLHWVLENEN